MAILQPGELPLDVEAQSALDRLFAMPVIWAPTMEPEQWAGEIQRMFARSQAVTDFVSGKLSPDDFADALADQHIDPYGCLNDWEDGHSYL
jgi:hypothetical protein